jgi:hypothetical protein
MIRFDLKAYRLLDLYVFCQYHAIVKTFITPLPGCHRFFSACRHDGFYYLFLGFGGMEEVPPLLKIQP